MAKTPEEINDLNKAAQEFLSTVASMSANLTTLAKDIEQDTGEAQARSIVTRREFVDIAEKLKRYSREDLADKRKANAFQRSLSDAKSKQAALEAEINELLERGGENLENLTKEEKKKLEVLTDAEERYKGIVGQAEQLRDELNRIDDEVTFFDDLNEFGKQIPGLSKLFGEFENASKAARKAATEGKNATLAAAEQLTSAGGKLAVSFGIKKVVDGIKEGQTRITQFARELNISREAADELNTRLVRVAGSTTGLTANDLANSIASVSNYLGISADLSNDTATNIGTLTKFMGVSNEQAAKLVTYTAALGKDTKTFNNELIGSVLAQNAIGDSAVRYQDVLKDVADASAATQLTTSKFSGGIAKAAFQARKFGLNLMALEKSGQSLLNFESSIEAELEAELLTGKQLNLERARAAALTGDQATLAAELAKNFGTAQEFSDQNVLAQEAQAKAMGMTRDELAQTLMRQEAMQKLGVSTTADLKEKIKLEEENIRNLEKEGKYEEASIARRKLYNTLGDNETLRQEENRSLQERMAQAMERIADQASRLATFLEPVGDLFDFISSAAGETLSFTTKLGSKLMSLGAFFLDKFKGLIDNAGKYAMNFIPSLTKALFKGGGKVGAKTLLKKIPVLGLIVGLGMAYKRMADGDIFGGLAEIASGVASLFPGVGTGISMGIDAALIASDVAGLTGENKSVKSAENNLAIASGVGMAFGNPGAAAGLSTSALLGLIDAQNRAAKAAEVANEKLDKIANKDSGVYIDGYRAGEAFAMNKSGL